MAMCTCGRPGVHYKQTLCHACYEKRRRRSPGGRLSLEQRFFARVHAENDHGCWIWNGGLYGEYGKFTAHGIDTLAHRWSYEFLRAEIPDGLVIDHLCRNPPCVNPWHLEPVTRKVNSLRGEAPMIVAARLNVCARGHSLADALVVKTGRQAGRRNCRTCVHERWAAKASDPAFRARRAAYERARKAARR